MILVGECGLGFWHWMILDDRGTMIAEDIDFATYSAAASSALAYVNAFGMARLLR